MSPQFSLAEVEEWLRSHNKLKEVGGREWLWPELDTLRSRDEAGLVIAAAGQLLSGGRSVATEASVLSAEVQKLVSKAVELGQREGAAETFEFLLRRWLDANVRQIPTTPEPLAALMAEAAARMLHPQPPQADSALTVLDPACGTGHLLAAATAAGSRLTLIGCDRDPTLAALAAASMSIAAEGASTVAADIRLGDSLRADPHADVRADIVLCNPPFNERDWGYQELATDPRWVHGLPPRTEPELAWVQHALARLRPGGTAVMLLPPATASRKAGRRIRGSLVRTGVLRAVVALPPGCAQPHNLSLHLWMLRAPAEADRTGVSGTVLLADAALSPPVQGQASGPNWEALGEFLTSAVDAASSPEHDQSALPGGIVRVAAIDLLDDEVDLTPGRHASRASAADGSRLAETWREFTSMLGRLSDIGQFLAGLDLDLEGGSAGTQPAATVGDLARAEALVLRGGQHPADGTVRTGKPSGDGVPLLTVPDLLLGGAPRGWLSAPDAAAGGAVVAEQGDVVVAGVLRAFSAWVHEGRPIALGAQMYALRVSPEKLDAWFLAGCLRAPSNGRQASTHVSNASRVDVRRLQVRQVPLEEQHRYGEAFRRVAAFEKLLSRVADLGSGLARNLGEALAAGRLPGGS